MTSSAGGNVEIGSPKNILLKAITVQKMGASDYRVPPPPLPSGHSEFFILKNQKTGQVIANRSYRITTSEGEVYTGISDKNGKTVEVYTAKPSELKIEFM
ncbi:hypothetical protein [Thorsellia kenyensis]|uniref:Uncharacterized protein n=1 Tax=Thorsellia kenyensis TaxID=1549888 RepID=A0ABV6CDE2_9GAMM